jgi:hypothetical protein
MALGALGCLALLHYLKDNLNPTDSCYLWNNGGEDAEKLETVGDAIAYIDERLD